MCAGAPTFPPDIIHHIALHLLKDRALGSLANLQSTSSGVYQTVTPILFSNLEITFNSTTVDIDPATQLNGHLEAAVKRAIGTRTFWTGAERNVRRLYNLRFVKHLTIRQFPDDTISRAFLRLATGPAQTPLYLPQLESVHLLPDAVDAIRKYIPPDYDRPHNPPFLEALLLISQPRELNVYFRVVQSGDWETHRDLTPSGAYQLVSRLAACIVDTDTDTDANTGTPELQFKVPLSSPAEGSRPRRGTWIDSLERFTVWDITHQVLPALPGVKNTYHFASHVLHNPGWPSTYRTLEPGPGAAYLPGPQWNYRSWQLASAVKPLFSSTQTTVTPLANRAPAPTPTPTTTTPLANGTGETEKTAGWIVDSTSWTFYNTAGHILTKAVRDDDDDSGVGWEEVDGLIVDALRNGLRADLSAREGFDPGLFVKLWARVKFGRQEGTERRVDVTVSSIRDVT